MHGFNLFDGVDRITSFGYFHRLEPREIVARVHFLLGNIDLAFKRIEAKPELPQAAEAHKLLVQMAVEVLVPQEADKDRMSQRVTELRTAIRDVPVVLHRPSDITAAVKQEYDTIDV